MKTHLLKSYLSHWLNKVDEHSIHSPFFYDFYVNVIRKSREAAEIKEIEKIRANLLENNSSIEMQDLGAGTSKVRNGNRTLADITKLSASPVRRSSLSSLYTHIIDYCAAKYIVELGTSIGLNALYLASKKDGQVFTFEGSKALANVALTHFEYFESKNIHLIEGNIDKTLPEFLQKTDKLNFVLMDANHRYEPTMRYFELLTRRLNEKSIVVVDDIHWSPEMESAWKQLYRHKLVYGSIDLYRCGILLFDPALNRQHFILSL